MSSSTWGNFGASALKGLVHWPIDSIFVPVTGRVLTYEFPHVGSSNVGKCKRTSRGLPRTRELGGLT